MATAHVDFWPAGIDLNERQQAKVRHTIEARELYRKGFVSFGRDLVHLGAVPIAEAEAWAKWALDLGEGKDSDPPGGDSGPKPRRRMP